MLAVLLAFIRALAATSVDPGLCDAYQRAAWSWYPHRAAVAEVRYCEAVECDRVWRAGGGLWDGLTRSIVIDARLSQRDTLLVLMHEYGHALGLDHQSGYSIMRPGWDEPIVPSPQPADLRLAASR